MSKWGNFQNINARELNAQAQTIRKTEYTEIPDGTYELGINSMTVKLSKSGNPMLTVAFKVVHGDYKGQYTWMNHVLMNGSPKDNVKFHMGVSFLQSLKTGVPCDPADLDDLERIVDLMATMIAEKKLEYLVEIKTNNGFRNYYIKEVYEGTKTNEDIPF